MTSGLVQHLGDNLSRSQVAALELVHELTQRAKTESQKVSSTLEERDRAIVKAIDVHGVAGPIVARVALLTPTRVNQILAKES